MDDILRPCLVFYVNNCMGALPQSTKYQTIVGFAVCLRHVVVCNVSTFTMSWACLLLCHGYELHSMGRVMQWKYFEWYKWRGQVVVRPIFTWGCVTNIVTCDWGLAALTFTHFSLDRAVDWPWLSCQQSTVQRLSSYSVLYYWWLAFKWINLNTKKKKE